MRVKRHCLPIAAICCAVFNHGAHAQLANSPWPMFRHDERHTGRSQYEGPRNCKLAWSYATGQDIQSSPAIGPDGRVYVGSQDSYLYAFMPGGALAWSYKTGFDIVSSPAIVADGRIYVGSADARIYAFTPGGTLAWSYYTVNYYIVSSPAIGSDGRVYIGSQDASCSGQQEIGLFSISRFV